jgi:hypothetical protein
MFLDLKRFQDLGTEVFAEKMVVDYTPMFGGEPYETGGKEQAETWKKQVGGVGQLAACHYVGLPFPSRC